MLPIYEAIIINPGLINQKPWQVLIDLYLYEATGCCLPASGRGKSMLDHTELPARGCCRDLSIMPFVFLAHGGTLFPGEGWGCRHIKMIKSGPRMCTEYFLLQRFSRRLAPSTQSCDLTGGCWRTALWNGDGSGRILPGWKAGCCVSVNCTTGERQHPFFQAAKFAPF